MVIYSNGQGSVILRVKLRSTAVGTGAGLTGLTSASAGLIIATIADTESATTRYRASSSEVETITTLGTYSAPTSGKCRFKEVDATNHPGLYEIQLADARLAVSNAKSAIVSLSGATSLVETDLLIALQAVNPYDSVRGGMTSLPNAAAEASGGLATLSAAQASNGTIQANVHRWLTGTPNALQSGRVDSYLGAVASGVIAAASFAANALDAVWSTATRLLTAGTNIVLAKGVGLTGFNDLSAAQVNAEADTALLDVGLTSTVTGRIDVAVSSRGTGTALDAAGMRSAVGLASANLDTQLDTLPTNSELATALGTADDATLAAIAALSIPTAAQNADKLLGRNLASGSDGGRTVQDALRATRNRVVVDGTTITVYAEDDTTPAWTGTVTRVSRDALQEVNPA